MHELHALVSIDALRHVVLEVLVYISVFQCFFIVQSWVGSLIFIGVLLWITSGFNFASVVVYAFLALAAGYATTKVVNISKENRFGFEVNYYIIQPFLLAESIRLFVAQTRVAVGYPLGFLVWLAINLGVYYIQGKRFWKDWPYYTASFGPIVLVFAMGFIFDDEPWVAVGITLVIQAGMLLFLWRKLAVK